MMTIEQAKDYCEQNACYAMDMLSGVIVSPQGVLIQQDDRLPDFQEYEAWLLQNNMVEIIQIDPAEFETEEPTP